MAIEKMKMLNIVLPKQDVYPVLRQVSLKERVEMIDAQRAIDETSFLLTATVENAEVIQELAEVGAYTMPTDADRLSDQLAAILVGTNWKPTLDVTSLDKTYDYTELEQQLTSYNLRLAAIEQERQALRPYAILAELGMDMPLDRMAQMEYLTYRVGLIHPASYQRLRLNAENISAMFLRLGTYRRQEVCLFVYPKILETETERILLSVQFDEIVFDPMFYAIDAGTTPTRLRALRAEAEEISRRKESLLDLHKEAIDGLFTKAKLDKQLEEVAAMIGQSENFAYLSMWVPADRVEPITQMIRSMSEAIIGAYGSAEARSIEHAPTSLKNNRLFRPFESLVLMYDVPNYHELDPTPFFAIAYTVLFGAMFGDLGQGLIILLAGLLMVHKWQMAFGGLLVRLGAASMIFGFFYDSLFGFEHVISAIVGWPIFFYPFENTNLVLIAAIMVGLFLLIVGYGYGIINKYKLGDIDGMLLGKTGLAGLILFLSLLLSLLPMVVDVSVPSFITWPVVIISALLIVLKEPIGNALRKEDRLFDQGLGEFLTEQLFELIETFLSMFSNGLSFIRVGAFTLSHVGLFVAFHTLADMIGGAQGAVSMAIVGNLLIIVLEGLVVFIQGLRLMYYELFSKYFVGQGRRFKALKLEEK
ncbi:MAG TPA: hypothetical protein GXZ74_01890 [Tissierellia bacterium]|nr:hypothetical protein [Tissierellia bacterium]